MHSAAVSETEFLGLNFMQMDEGQALEWLFERSKQESFSYVVTPNVDHIVQLYRDPELLDHVYSEAHLRLCDSRVIALMAQMSGQDLPFVTGSGLTARMLSKPLPAGTSIAEIFYHEPPMGLRTNLAAQADAAAFVEKVRADIVLITVGAPQSELIASLIHSRGAARGVALCVGASLEFITGEKRRAPPWVQALAMEWAFRLVCEPRRLARRYLVDGPRIFSIWRQWSKAGGSLRPLPGVLPAPAGSTVAWQPHAEIGPESGRLQPTFTVSEETPRFGDATPAPEVVPARIISG
jgi:N-acetylglucosaminyldiphosphoundecaprenol N-acetyl-beta-D-mannosaminyltransferase